MFTTITVDSVRKTSLIFDKVLTKDLRQLKHGIE